MPSQQFRFKLEKLGKSKRTITEYSARFRDFYHYLINELNKFNVFEVTTVDIVSYKEFLQRKQQSRNTINGKLNAISLFYKLLVLDGYITENPVPSGIYIIDNAPELPLLTYGQTETLKAWMDGVAPEVGTAFWLMYGAGLRIGEVARLTRRDIIFSLKRVYVNVRDDDDCKNRIVPLLNVEAAHRVKVFAQFFNGGTDDKLFTINKKLIHYHAQAFINVTGIQLYSHIFRYMIANFMRSKGVPEEFIALYMGEKPRSFNYNEDELEELRTQLLEHIDPIAPTLNSLKEEV